MADSWVIPPGDAVFHRREVQVVSNGATVDSVDLFLSSTPGQHLAPGGVMAERYGMEFRFVSSKTIVPSSW